MIMTRRTESRTSPALLITMLLAVHVLSHIDRHILSVLVPSIRRDIPLSDTQVGFLIGPAFALLYGVFGFISAKYAARYDRVTIVALACALWSGVTGLAALATGFLWLAAARMLVAVGEAGSGPASVSMIADGFPIGQRGRAMAIYGLASSLGVMTAFAIGGVIAAHLGWRWVFPLLGVMGFLLAIATRMLLTDPRKQTRQKAAPLQSSTSSAFAAIWGSPAARWLIAGCSACVFVVYGMIAWLPSFLVRSHGLDTASAGLSLGIIIGVGGFAASLAGGIASDKLGAVDRRWSSWVIGACLLLSAPLGILYPLLDSVQWALAVYAVFAFLSGTFYGPTYAMIQSLVPSHARPMAVAILLAIGNFIGAGLGPQSIGLASDFLGRYFGSDGLAVALSACAALQLFAAYGYFRGGGTYGREVEALAAASAEGAAVNAPRQDPG